MSLRLLAREQKQSFVRMLRQPRAESRTEQEQGEELDRWMRLLW